MLEEITDFIHKHKNKSLETQDIIKLKDEFSNYANWLKNSDYYKEFYNNYLNIKAYTYRLNDSSQRLFYTFQEAVYAVDLAKLMRDEDSVKLNTIVYALVLNDCINEYLNIDIDEKIKAEALEFYKNEQNRISKENAKYHMYQN